MYAITSTCDRNIHCDPMSCDGHTIWHQYVLLHVYNNAISNTCGLTNLLYTLLKNFTISVGLNNYNSKKIKMQIQDTNVRSRLRVYYRSWYHLI